MDKNDLATLIKELSPGDVLVRDELCTDQFCDDLSHQLRALVLDRHNERIRVAKFVGKQPLSIAPMPVDLRITDKGTIIDDTGTMLLVSDVEKGVGVDLIEVSTTYEEIILGTITKPYALGAGQPSTEASFAAMRAIANDDRLKNSPSQAYAALQMMGVERPTPDQVMKLAVFINTQRDVGVNVGRQIAIPAF